MADNVTLPGTGALVATDDNGTSQVQWVKLQYGANGSFTAVDAAAPLPVTVISGGDGSVQGVDAHSASITGDPVLIGLEARTAVGTAVSNGEACRGLSDIFGKQVIVIGALHEEQLQGSVNFTTNSAADLIAAQGSGIKIAITSVLVTNAHATVSTKVTIRDKTTTTRKLVGYTLAAGGGFILTAGGRPLLISDANSAIEAICGTTGSDIDVSVSGYLIKN